MADTSERVIILSAVVLVIILWIPNSGLIQTIVTIDDLEIEIVTSRDNYTLGENFTANVYLVNTRSRDVWMEPIIGIPFSGGSNYDNAGTLPHVFINFMDGRLHIPANSKAQLLHQGFKPTKLGEFIIQCSGVRKTVLILDSEPEGAHARKSSFARGEIVAFNFESTFPQPDSYIKIYDPNSTLFWRTEAFVDSWWFLKGGLYTVPYNRQTTGGNPMILAPDAPLGRWSWEWYDNFDDELDNGTFTVYDIWVVNGTSSDSVGIWRPRGENSIAPPAHFGVREGDWVEYRFSFYLESPEVVIQDNDYKTTVRILDVTGTNVTFEEDRRYLNGSIAFQQIVSGNPNEPHYHHPLFRINDLFMPAGLEAGNYIPQTVSHPDSKDQYVSVPWTQYINETVEMPFLGVKREVNHFYWNRHIRGDSSDGKSTFDYFVERDGYYDKSTGVMLQWFYNYSKIYHRKDTGEEYVLRGTYDYNVSDTNLWSVPLWVRREVQIVATASLSLIAVFVAIWMKRDWLYERIVGATNG